MKVLLTPCIVIAAILATSVPSYAQFTPVVAKTKELEEISKDGKVFETHIREGVYYRSSDGSILEHWTTIDGSPEKAKLSMGGNTFLDNTNGHVYSLDLQNHKARLQSAGRRAQPDSWRQGLDVKSHPEEWVNGIKCEVIPLVMRIQIPGKDFQEFKAGQTCTAVDYGLLVKREMTYPSTDGRTEHVVWTMQSMEIGKEPDSKLFEEVRSLTSGSVANRE